MSGGSSAPSQTSSTQVVDLPEWAKPYAKESLGKASALTDTAQNPYQQYSGERQAGFTPMQEQAFQSAQRLDAGPSGFYRDVGAYMSPYMQGVVDVQKREAFRDAGIQAAQQRAQATGAGAFGGYREGIQRAEQNRNLATQLGDIQAKGLQSAYEQAANQFRQAIPQQIAATQLQQQYGAQQQAQQQAGMDIAYQDFLNQQRYPYQQLEFMSNVLRGTPMGTVSSMYAPPASPLSQLAGLGTAAYGASQLMKDGGQVQARDRNARGAGLADLALSKM